MNIAGSVTRAEQQTPIISSLPTRPKPTAWGREGWLDPCISWLCVLKDNYGKKFVS